jgi:hypothetical protein
VALRQGHASGARHPMRKDGIEDYLRELAGHMSAGPRRRRLILTEVRDHLTRRVEDEKAKGTDPKLAEALAITEFGEPASTGRRISPPISPSVPVPFPMGGYPTPSSMPVARRRQSKTVLLVYGAIGLLVLSIVAAMALVFVPPSPPTISEFQPLVQKEIQEAPSQQSSKFGSGGSGLCAAGPTCQQPQPASHVQKRVIEKARVRRCVGNPPRQTEDPQSPPCVNFWEGDNGGATAKGVTRDEIRIAVPYLTYPAYSQKFQALVNFFNTRYEFYGRKLRLLDLGSFVSDPEKQRAAAQKAAQELDSFAALNHPSFSAAPFRRELARLGAIGTFGHSWLGSMGDLQSELSPLAWDYYAPLEDSERNLAEFVCKALVGRRAQYSGPTLDQQQRRFAAVFLKQNSYRDIPPTEPLQQGLSECGESLHVAESAVDDQSVLTAIADLRSRGITTVILLDDDTNASNRWLPDASKAGYYPEWLLVGTSQERDDQWGVAPPDQLAHMFGVVPWNKFLPIQDEPDFWAIKEGDPSVNSALTTDVKTIDDYHAFLLLASGVQMAGPKLNPASFARGLERARFPDPGAGAPPYFQASVGFSPSHHSMTNDFALVWWSSQAPTYRVGTGTGQRETGGGFCWVLNGTRWSLGNWPSSNLPLFDLDPRKCR